MHRVVSVLMLQVCQRDRVTERMLLHVIVLVIISMVLRGQCGRLIPLVWCGRPKSGCSCYLRAYSVTECMFLHDTLLVVMFMVSQGSTQSLPHERAHATEPMDRQTRQMLSSPATGRSRTTWPARSRGTACTTPASTPPLRSGSRRISEPAAPQGLP